MPSLIDLRRRIRSVKNTQQITKAMKMVSAAKLRRAQERVVAARPYSGMLQRLLANVAAAASSGAQRAPSAPPDRPETPELPLRTADPFCAYSSKENDAASHPLLAVREEKRVLLILVTADGGLAGAFNGNLNKAAQMFLDDRKTLDVRMETVGRKGRDYFKRRNVSISGEHVGLSQKFTYADAARIAGGVMERYAAGAIDAVYVLYNEFKSVMTQKLTVTRILPVPVPQSSAPLDYIYEQPPAELLGTLLPRYVEVEVYRAMLESGAAEHAARMTAMDAASSNAAEVIDKLTLYMNRVRQASITREIIEVVSGAAAQE